MHMFRFTCKKIFLFVFSFFQIFNWRGICTESSEGFCSTKNTAKYCWRGDFLGVEFLLFLNIINSPKYQNAYFFVVHEFVLYLIFVEHEFVVYVIINPTHYTAVPWTWTSVGWYTSEEVPSYSCEMVCLWIVILFALSVFLWYRNFYGC
jgi:hypothetical protein